jgi:hypothetical protein
MPSSAQFTEAQAGAQTAPYTHKIGRKSYTFRPLNKAGYAAFRAMGTLEATAADPEAAGSSSVVALFELMIALVAPAQRPAFEGEDVGLDVLTEIFEGWQAQQGPKAE